MPFAGYLISVGQFSLIGAATAGAIGCNVGSTIAYIVAAKGGRPAFERWGSYVLVSHAELERAEHFFARYGAITVFIGRLLPVIRTFISFPAGLARMPMVKFQIYSFIGSWPWCFALAYVGMVLGARWDSDPTFRKLFHDFDAVIVAVASGGLCMVRLVAMARDPPRQAIRRCAVPAACAFGLGAHFDLAAAQFAGLISGGDGAAALNSVEAKSATWR